MKDENLINDLCHTLKINGVNLLIAEHDIDMTDTVSVKIEKMIHKSNIAIFLLTENGFNSHFVHQEIGYIEKMKIPRLYVIDKKIKDNVTGFVFGKDYILYESEKPDEAIKKLRQTITKYAKNYYNKLKKISTQNEDRVKVIAIIGVLATILIGVFLYNKPKRKSHSK